MAYRIISTKILSKGFLARPKKVTLMFYPLASMDMSKGVHIFHPVRMYVCPRTRFFACARQRMNGGGRERGPKLFQQLQ